MQDKMQENEKYHGTYSVRRIGKSENGIHIPSEFSGDYAIFSDELGHLILVPVGKK